MEFLAVLMGLPLLGAALTWTVSKLYGPAWSNRFPLVLVGLLLASMGLAFTNPTFESGMLGAIGSIALIPTLLGATLASLLISRRLKKIHQPDAPGLNRTPE